MKRITMADLAQRRKGIRSGEREAYALRLKNHILGLYWTLQNHPDIRADFREWIGRWGLPKDEYVATGHFSPQVYVREGRRMIGEWVVTQYHCEGLHIEPDLPVQDVPYPRLRAALLRDGQVLASTGSDLHNSLH